MSDDKPVPSRDNTALESLENVERYVNLTYRAGIILIIVLSGIYALSPVDTVPDIVPLAGQVDDLAALISGGGAIAFITAIRPFVMAIMKRPVMRAGCLFIAAMTIFMLVGSSIALFYGLSRILSLAF
jgi:hypothetical protein